MSAEGNYDPTEFANLNGSSSEYDKPTFDADMAALPAYPLYNIIKRKGLSL